MARSTVEASKCNALLGVPTMFIAALEHPRFREFDLSSLRTVIMAGAPCPEPLMRRVMRRKGVTSLEDLIASAREAGSTAKLMNVLFQRALFVGKLVRSRTGIALGQTSVASVAVELAQRIFGPLRGREVLLLGAGATAEKAARHLREAKAGRLHIANRTFERAQALAAALGGAPGCARAVRWEGFPALLDTVDIVLASTGAPEPVLGRAEVEEALRRRRSSLFLIDIAMPRDIAQEVGSLDGAYLYTLCDLEALASDNALKRRGEADAAREIVRLEAQAFSAWLEASLRGEKVTLRRASLPAQAAA